MIRMSKTSEKERVPMSFLLVLSVLLPSWFSTVSAFSVSANPSHSSPRKPAVHVEMTAKERRQVMTSLWHCTSDEKNPKEALRLLDRLLQNEQNSDYSKVLKPGVVFNVLSTCQSYLDESSLEMLERVHSTLQENDRLYNKNMTSMVARALSRNSQPERAEKLLIDLQRNFQNSGSPSVLNSILNGYAEKAMVANAEQLLHRMEEQRLGLDATSYSIVMKALSRSRQSDAPEKAQQLLERMEKFNVKPTLITYNTLLRCFANRGMVVRTEQLLQRMQCLYEEDKLDAPPNKFSLQCVADAKRSKTKGRRRGSTSDAPRRPNLSLGQDLSNVTAQLLDAPRVDQASFKDAIWFQIKKNANKKKGAKMALLLLVRMLEEENSIVEKGMVFNVLRACQQNSASDADALEKLLSLLEDHQLLDDKILTEILVAMTKCQDDGTLLRAEAMLRAPFVNPNNYHFCAILNGYAKVGNALKAEGLLRQMQDVVLPNTVAYNTVLHALSKTSENNAVVRAEGILNKMQKDDCITPDMFTYTNMFNLYSKHAMGEKAGLLLEQVDELHRNRKLKRGPNEYTYRCVIDALSKSGQADAALSLLEKMSERNTVANKYHFCGVLNGYAREGRPVEAERLLDQMVEVHAKGQLMEVPDEVPYNCVMAAWAKSGEVDAPFRARALLDRMLEAKVTPNVITYNCLLCACGNRGMAKECEQLLKQMHDLHEAGDLDEQPNAISYNYVLDSLARSGDRAWTVLRAESLVNKMNDLYKSGIANTKPTMITYRSLLKCYANWNLSEDAERLLQCMQHRHERGKLDYGPDRVSYQVVIDALQKSEDPETRQKVDALKKEVEKLYGKKGWKLETPAYEYEQIDALLEYMSD